MMTGGVLVGNDNQMARFPNEQIADIGKVDQDITRCLCGNVEPPTGSDLYIQCDQCLIWQHGKCMGISDIVPEQYWCHNCKPTFHQIISNIDAIVRSEYRGMDASLSKVEPRRKKKETIEQIIGTTDKKSRQITVDASLVNEKKKRKITRKKSTLGGQTDKKKGSEKQPTALQSSFKPRIPSQRTSLNEMRRRTFAILEFISRTRYELEYKNSEREELVKFVDNAKFIEKIGSVFTMHDETLALMNELAGDILNWEQKYANGLF